jgi:hypothetical protein
MTASIEIGSTWQHPTDGTLWQIDHRRSATSHVLRPDFGYSIGVPDHIEVDDSRLTGYWTMIETSKQRHERSRRTRKNRCRLDRHEDPDNSGLCIHCGIAL